MSEVEALKKVIKGLKGRLERSDRHGDVGCRVASALLVIKISDLELALLIREPGKKESE